jgi:hypothetical protein
MDFDDPRILYNSDAEEIELFERILSMLSNEVDEVFEEWIQTQLDREIPYSKWKQEQPEECIVCYESIHDNDLLSCGHYIHKKCIIKTNKTYCPICKKEIYLSREDLTQYVIN